MYIYIYIHAYVFAPLLRSGMCVYVHYVHLRELLYIYVHSCTSERRQVQLRKPTDCVGGWGFLPDFTARCFVLASPVARRRVGRRLATCVLAVSGFSSLRGLLVRANAGTNSLQSKSSRGICSGSGPAPLHLHLRSYLQSLSPFLV